MNPVVKSAKEIVLKEIKYLSGFYPHNLKRYLSPAMIYASSIVAFMDPISEFPHDFQKRLINLFAGIELLAAGVNLHSFNIEDFVMLTSDVNPGVKKINKVRSEKNYTVDLLFGDVFYSRAVIYILRYDDFNIFSSILQSLKSAHKSKLFLHQKIVDTLNKNRDRLKNLDKKIKGKNNYEKHVLDLLEENEVFLPGVNSLLKTSFFLGWGIFLPDTNQKLPYELINDFVLLKTFSDLKDFLSGLPQYFNFLRNISYIEQKKQEIKNRINDAVLQLKPNWFGRNIKSLERIY